MSLSRRFGFSILVLVLAAPVLAAPPGRPSKQYTIEQFLETVSISGASFSAAESIRLLTTSRNSLSLTISW